MQANKMSIIKTIWLNICYLWWEICIHVRIQEKSYTLIVWLQSWINWGSVRLSISPSAKYNINKTKQKWPCGCILFDGKFLLLRVFLCDQRPQWNLNRDLTMCVSGIWCPAHPFGCLSWWAREKTLWDFEEDIFIGY